MSLGIKQLYPDPWVNIEAKYGVGSRHKGVVRNLTNYGLFLELEEGVDGLVHVSDLSWSKKIKHPSEFVKKDQELEVVVLEVDTESRRLSLGHKQLEDNPWDAFEDLFALNSEHEGTILKIADKNAVVALPYGVEGYCPLRQLKKEDGNNAAEDEVLKFRVTEFNKENRRITLSHTASWKEDEQVAPAAEKTAKAGKSSKKAVVANAEKDTLGDLDALSALKSQLDAQEKKGAAKKVTKKKSEDSDEDSSEENA